MTSVSEELDVFKGSFVMVKGFADAFGETGVGESASSCGAGVVVYAIGVCEVYLWEASSSLYCEELFSVDPVLFFRDGG